MANSQSDVELLVTSGKIVVLLVISFRRGTC